ncbi:hypothetical protein BH10BAC1_BH10BAC1_02570 [soil metagenome]
MKKSIFILVASFASSLLIAQGNSPKYQIPEFLVVKSHKAFVLPGSEPTKSLVVNPANFSDNTNFHLTQSVKFPAFFCQMELKSMYKYNVWIKIHAGEYDKYSTDKLPD